MNAPARSGSAEASSAEAVLETCKQSDCCQLLPWAAVEIPLPLSEAQWEWRIHSIDWGRAEHIDFDELDRLEKEEKEKRSGNEDEKTPRKAIVSYVEWEGTRSHPHLVMRQEYAIIMGRWAYLESGRRKDTTGGHFESCEFLSRAPKGTAEIFRDIAKGMKRTHQGERKDADSSNREDAYAAGRRHFRRRPL